MPNIMTDALAKKFHEEICQTDWAPLQRNFAQGEVLWVSPELDLIDTAICVATDNAAKIGDWLSKKLLAKPTMENAAYWRENNTQFLMLIVQPFVLVQPGIMAPKAKADAKPDAAAENEADTAADTAADATTDTAADITLDPDCTSETDKN